MKLLFLNIPKLSWQLSSKSYLMFCRIIVQLYFFVFTRKVFVSTQRKPFKLFGVCNGKKISFFLRKPMDLASLVEVFVLKEYEWELSKEPKIIVDLGAHFGDTTVYLNARYPNAKIIAVEPEPSNYKRLLEHVSEINNIIPVQAAVGVRSGEIQFYLGKSSLGYSIFKQKEASEAIKVNQFTLKELFDIYGIEKADLIKFDIEGAEIAMLKGMNVDKLSNAYIGELHFDLDDSSNVTEIKDKFLNFDIELMELKNQSRFIIKAKAKPGGTRL